MKITTISAKGLELIKFFEGLSLAPYLCSAGVPTIGFGTIRYPNGVKVTLQDHHISKAQAEEYLRHEVHQFELAVDALCVDTINQNMFDALTSFSYNLGANALRNSTLLKKVNANPNDPTIKDEFARWNKAAGQVITGLVKRRQMEATHYFSV